MLTRRGDDWCLKIIRDRSYEITLQIALVKTANGLKCSVAKGFKAKKKKKKCDDIVLYS